CRLSVTSHSVNPLGSMADNTARYLESGEKATSWNQDARCKREEESAFVDASQRRTLPSALPDTSVWPSGLKARDITVCWCPLNVSRVSGSLKSCTQMFQSLPAEASRRPSGEKIRSWMMLTWPSREGSWRKEGNS